jgi:hypothetical protein
LWNLLKYECGTHGRENQKQQGGTMPEVKVLEGGCVLVRLPTRKNTAPRPKLVPEMEAPRVWREMTDQERKWALAFGETPWLLVNPLARAMYRKAQTNDVITDKQGRAIYAIAKRYGIISQAEPGTTPAA